jgi:hypothetical protein
MAGEVVQRVGTADGPPEVPGDFYVMVLSPDVLGDGRMDCFDESGNPGAEGERLRLP